MENAFILVVEDDEDINRLLCRILQKQGYATDAAYSGSEARLLLEKKEYDLILLDLMLPGVTGEELVKQIRSGRTTPIIVISAKGGIEDKVELLKLGADDYMVKPFEGREVAARVEAQLRRFREFAPRKEEPKVLRFRNLTLDRDTMRAELAGQELTLTAREFGILELLMACPERVFTRENLYRQVWGESYYGEDNTVNVHISNIRQKLAKVTPGEEYIKTVWGIGFKLAGE